MTADVRFFPLFELCSIAWPSQQHQTAERWLLADMPS